MSWTAQARRHNRTTVKHQAKHVLQSTAQDKQLYVLGLACPGPTATRAPHRQTRNLMAASICVEHRVSMLTLLFSIPMR